MTDITLERSMPCNPECERAVLGAILLDPPCLYEACEALDKDDFYLEGHRKVFASYMALHASETAIDPITVKAELQRSGNLEAAGGPAYIVSLTDGLPRGLNVRHYAGLVREASILRRLIQSANDAMMRAYEGEDKSGGIIDDLQLELIRLAERKRGGWRKIAELVKEAYEEIDQLVSRKTETTGIDTGFVGLNKLTQGFHPGQLIVVAGRPGHGKTSLGMNVICHAITKHSKRVGLFTIEMSARECVKRILYADAEVDSHRVGSGYVSKEDMRRIIEAAGRLADTHLSVDESGSLTIMDLRSRAQQLMVSGGCDLIVIDYLQLMAGSSRGRSERNRVQEISDISRGLKSLAKDLNIPIIAMSQLNRDVERETARRPRLADLRESGSIEQDADVVLFIWREELRNQTEENIGTAELIIGKQRNGPVGETVRLTFLKQYTNFVDAATPEQANQAQAGMYWQRD